MKITLASKYLLITALSLAGTPFNECRAQQTEDHPSSPFRHYKDSTVLTMSGFSDFGAHGSVVHPQVFKMQIPKDGRYTRPFTVDYSVIGFPAGQTIIVVMNHTASDDELKDSMWTAAKPYLDVRFRRVGLHKGIDGYFPREGRISKICKRLGHEIMLLNIKPKNFDKFMIAVNTFTIIPDSIPRVRRVR